MPMATQAIVNTTMIGVIQRRRSTRMMIATPKT